ncbi:hypothetical protein CY34DRAFT_804283 [Suillus luteus UH-Slu-Lm8-n1]|uniref:Uncharacterized protein n=1 Tax=Suillus luteus UH-Slu-Lm8-n1 TaxID=930992 RepID=A0A0D0AMK8_9AGAM|nr:hypothetical protein CY34DRAFT_804283 [Suillus luteus UH-Slu-Lm8-n1]
MFIDRFMLEGGSHALTGRVGQAAAATMIGNMSSDGQIGLSVRSYLYRVCIPMRLQGRELAEVERLKWETSISRSCYTSFEGRHPNFGVL